MKSFEELCPSENLKKDTKVRNAIITEYAPLIRYIATKIHLGLPPSIELDDLINIGALGLIDAIDKYDTTRGVLFKTYAESRIRGKILDELRKLDWLPRGLRQKNKALERAYAKLGILEGGDFEESKLASELGITEAELPTFIAQASGYTMLSLDEGIYDKDGTESGTFGEMLADEEHDSPATQVEDKQTRDFIQKRISTLSEKEQQVIVLYYYEELTMKEIGLILDITESRVSQIHSKALFRLKKSLEQLT